MEKLERIELEIGGKTREVKLTLNSLCDFEGATGKTIFTLDGGKISLSDLRALLWASLRHEDSALTLDVVGDWIDVNDADQMKLVAEKVSAALPQ